MAVASLAVQHTYARRRARHALSAALRCWQRHARMGACLADATAATARRVAARSGVRSGMPSEEHSRSVSGRSSGQGATERATRLACELRTRAELAAAFGTWARPATRAAAARRLWQRVVRGRLGAGLARLVAAAEWRGECRHAVRTFVWRGGAVALRTWLAQVAVALARQYALRRAACHWRLQRTRASLRRLRAHARGAYARCRELSRVRHASDRAVRRALRTWCDAGRLHRLVRAAVRRRLPSDCRRALATWMQACALRLALRQMARRTARMLVAQPLRGAWSALRAGGARWAVLRRCVVARISKGLLCAVGTWREVAAEARVAARALRCRQLGALVAALAAWRRGAAPRRRLCEIEISARCALLRPRTALRRWRRDAARATSTLQRLHAAAAARRCRGAVRGFRAWAEAAGAAISESAFKHRSAEHRLKVRLGQGITLWRRSALRRRRAAATLEAGALRWLAMGLVPAMAANPTPAPSLPAQPCPDPFPPTPHPQAFWDPNPHPSLHLPLTRCASWLRGASTRRAAWPRCGGCTGGRSAGSSSAPWPPSPPSGSTPPHGASSARASCGPPTTCCVARGGTLSRGAWRPASVRPCSAWRGGMARWRGRAAHRRRVRCSRGSACARRRCECGPSQASCYRAAPGEGCAPGGRRRRSDRGGAARCGVARRPWCSGRRAPRCAAGVRRARRAARRGRRRRTRCSACCARERRERSRRGARRRWRRARGGGWCEGPCGASSTRREPARGTAGRRRGSGCTASAPSPSAPSS